MDASPDIVGATATTPASYTVVNKRWEFNGTATLHLARACEKDSWSPAAPGQFAMLYALGVGEAAISFSGLPETPGRYVVTVRRAGAISDALTRLKRGDGLGLRGPFGVGWPLDSVKNKDVVVVAGGLGLAPLRPIIEYLAHDRGVANSVSVLYGARSPDAILFERDLSRWRNDAGMNVRVTVDAAASAWRGDVGLVTTLIPEIEFRPKNSVALICGPEIMMRFAAEAMEDAGLPQKAIWLSMERNMKCAVGFCGHCQFGSYFICKNGPIFSYDRIRDTLLVREL